MRANQLIGDLQFSRVRVLVNLICKTSVNGFCTQLLLTVTLIQIYFIFILFDGNILRYQSRPIRAPDVIYYIYRKLFKFSPKLLVEVEYK